MSEETRVEMFTAVRKIMLTRPRQAAARRSGVSCDRQNAAGTVNVRGYFIIRV